MDIRGIQHGAEKKRTYGLNFGPCTACTITYTVWQVLRYVWCLHFVLLNPWHLNLLHCVTRDNFIFRCISTYQIMYHILCFGFLTGPGLRLIILGIILLIRTPFFEIWQCKATESLGKISYFWLRTELNTCFFGNSPCASFIRLYAMD